ncbi:hypothetical protein [Methanomethylophilus alvi]|uniref:hypothetical protein n=1 Tax=Methanomethylophilus alvi TaxID=1291540 RepID=UPI0037DD4205
MFFANVGRNCGDTRFINVDFFKDNSEYVFHAYCPCCGEQLQIVHDKLGSPHFFRHNKTTEETKECEQRVSIMALTQTATNNYHPVAPVVPLYLVGEGSKFHLEVRFNPIPAELVPSDNSYLSIGSNKFLLRNINNWLFRREIERIPDCYSNMHLEYSSDCSPEIREINGSMVDSLQCGWGFFSADSGKKVHNGGCLYLDENYYLLAKDEKRVPPILKSNARGKYQDSEYLIYFVDFSIIYDTSELQSFLQQEKISLKKAEKHSLILWPPCSRQDGILKPCKSDSKVLVWADNPRGSRMYSDHGDFDGNNISKNIAQYASIKNHSIIDIEFDNAREDFDFSPLCDGDLAPCQELSVYYVANNNKTVNTFNKKVKSIHFNFNAVVEVYSKSGSCEHRHVRKGLLENDSDRTRLDIYSKYRFVKKIETENKLDDEISVARTDLLSYPRVKIPANLDSLLIRHFSDDPVKARMIKQSCSDGTISKRLLDKMLLSE